MRPETSIINDISKLLVSSNEFKNTQPIGSNQVVFNTYALPGVYDYGHELSHTTPSVVIFTVTATAKNQENLVADIAVLISQSATMSPAYTRSSYIADRLAGTKAFNLYIYAVPLPTTQSNMKKWSVTVSSEAFGPGGYAGSFYAKNQIIANDDIDIVVESVFP